jgi:hypothetical protein
MTQTGEIAGCIEDTAAGFLEPCARIASTRFRIAENASPAVDMSATDCQDFDRHAHPSEALDSRIEAGKPAAKSTSRLHHLATRTNRRTYFEHSMESHIISIASWALAKTEQKGYILLIGGFIAYAASIT